MNGLKSKPHDLIDIRPPKNEQNKRDVLSYGDDTNFPSISMSIKDEISAFTAMMKNGISEIISLMGTNQEENNIEQNYSYDNSVASTNETDNDYIAASLKDIKDVFDSKFTKISTSIDDISKMLIDFSKSYKEKTDESINAISNIYKNTYNSVDNTSITNKNDKNYSPKTDVLQKTTNVDNIDASSKSNNAYSTRNDTLTKTNNISNTSTSSNFFDYRKFNKEYIKIARDNNTVLNSFFDYIKNEIPQIVLKDESTIEKIVEKVIDKNKEFVVETVKENKQEKDLNVEPDKKTSVKDKVKSGIKSAADKTAKGVLNTAFSILTGTDSEKMKSDLGFNVDDIYEGAKKTITGAVSFASNKINTLKKPKDIKPLKDVKEDIYSVSAAKTDITNLGMKQTEYANVPAIDFSGNDKNKFSLKNNVTEVTDIRDDKSTSNNYNYGKNDYSRYFYASNGMPTTVKQDVNVGEDTASYEDIDKNKEFFTGDNKISKFDDNVKYNNVMNPPSNFFMDDLDDDSSDNKKDFFNELIEINSKTLESVEDTLKEIKEIKDILIENQEIDAEKALISKYNAENSTPENIIVNDAKKQVESDKKDEGGGDMMSMLLSKLAGKIPGAVKALGSAALTGGKMLGTAALTGGKMLGSAALTGGKMAGSAALTGGKMAGSAALTGGKMAGSAALTGGKMAGSAALTAGKAIGSTALAGGKALLGGLGSVASGGALTAAAGVTAAAAGGAAIGYALDKYVLNKYIFEPARERKRQKEGKEAGKLGEQRKYALDKLKEVTGSDKFTFADVPRIFGANLDSLSKEELDKKALEYSQTIEKVSESGSIGEDMYKSEGVGGIADAVSASTIASGLGETKQPVSVSEELDVNKKKISDVDTKNITTFNKNEQGKNIKITDSSDIAVGDKQPTKAKFTEETTVLTSPENVQPDANTGFSNAGMPSAISGLKGMTGSISGLLTDNLAKMASSMSMMVELNKGILASTSGILQKPSGGGGGASIIPIPSGDDFSAFNKADMRTRLAAGS